MARQSSWLLCVLNHAESSPPRLSCLSLERRVPAPQPSRNRLTSQLPVDTRRSLPVISPSLRSRHRECSADTNPWGPAAALSCLLQLVSGNPVAHNRSLILSSPR